MTTVKLIKFERAYDRHHKGFVELSLTDYQKTVDTCGIKIGNEAGSHLIIFPLDQAPKLIENLTEIMEESKMTDSEKIFAEMIKERDQNISLLEKELKASNELLARLAKNINEAKK